MKKLNTKKEIASLLVDLACVISDNKKKRLIYVNFCYETQLHVFESLGICPKLHDDEIEQIRKLAFEIIQSR